MEEPRRVGSRCEARFGRLRSNASHPASAFKAGQNQPHSKACPRVLACWSSSSSRLDAWVVPRGISPRYTASRQQTLRGTRRMAYLIGMDEAGYGPNLGPLIVSASVWRVPESLLRADLYDALDDVVTAEPTSTDQRVAIADSKLLYQPRGGLGRLERGLHIALATLGRDVSTWQAVWESLDADRPGHRHTLPWYAGYECSVPVDCDGSRFG